MSLYARRMGFYSFHFAFAGRAGRCPFYPWIISFFGIFVMDTRSVETPYSLLPPGKMFVCLSRENTVIKWTLKTKHAIYNYTRNVNRIAYPSVKRIKLSPITSLQRDTIFYPMSGPKTFFCNMIGLNSLNSIFLWEGRSVKKGGVKRI